MTQKLFNTLKQEFMPFLHLLMKERHHTGSYGNVLICVLETMTWRFRSMCHLHNTFNVVIFRNGKRMTRNVDYKFNDKDIREIIPVTKDWKATDVVIADIGV